MRRSQSDGQISVCKYGYGGRSRSLFQGFGKMYERMKLRENMSKSKEIRCSWREGQDPMSVVGVTDWIF